MFAEVKSAVAWTVWIHDSALIIVASGGTRDLDMMLADPASRKSLCFLWADVSSYSTENLLLLSFAFDLAGGGNESYKRLTRQGCAPPL
jgi:hypothetical protein